MLCLGGWDLVYVGFGGGCVGLRGGVGGLWVVVCCGGVWLWWGVGWV